jgi:YHS domain-containing protein
MKRLFTGPAFALALSASAFMTGCGGETTTTDEPAAPSAAPAGEEEAAGDADAAATDGGAATDGLTADQVEAFASLSPAEREAVIAQKICPVTEEPLGSMGPPLPVEIDGKTYYVCCEGCVDGLKEDPEKHLATIGVTYEAATGAETAPADDAAEGDAAGG